jgi:hypothetical protein
LREQVLPLDTYETFANVLQRPSLRPPQRTKAFVGARRRTCRHVKQMVPKNAEKSPLRQLVRRLL